MRKEYLPPKCGFHIEGGHIVTDGTVKGKVTGTMMAGILGCSPWSSPFRTACRILGLAEEDISDKPAVKTGRALERRVIDYTQDRYASMGLTFVSADEIYPKREGDHASWASDFDDEIFAGHVDGIVFDNNGDDYILEIKTSANLESWEEGVPEYYYWQVALYNEFMTHRDKVYVVLGIVSQEDYRRPEKWEGCDTNVVMYELPIDREDVVEKLEEVREWYSKYISKGITPDIDPSDPADLEMFEYLTSIADDESSQSTLVDRVAEIEATIKEKEADMKALYEARDRLRGIVKDWMMAHETNELASRSGTYQAKLTEQVRTSVDKSLLMAAGIDPTPYIVEKVSKVFTVRKMNGNEDGDDQTD